MPAEPPFAFISYPREVAALAARLHAHLAERMIPTWYDYHAQAGELFPKELSQRLAQCQALIVLVVPGLEDPTWLRREIGVARKAGKRIFPLKLPAAGEREMRQLGVERIQAPRLVDDTPPTEWVRAVHNQLYRPASSAEAQLDRTGRSGRRPLLIAVTVAAVVGAALGGAAGWWAHFPGAAFGGAGGSLAHSPGVAKGTAGDRCAGKAAHIDTVSTVSPGHTGYTPQIAVTVCAPPAQGHDYWLMDYTTGEDGRRFFAKSKVDGSPGARSYRVFHDKSTGASTPRTYLVLDVEPVLTDEVTRQWTSTDGGPLVPLGTSLPAGVTLISNEAPAVL